MKLNDYWRGAVLALAAATCWGMISPVAKVLATAGIDLMTVMTFRSMFTVIASGIFLLFTEGRDIFCFNAEYMRFYVISGILSVLLQGADSSCHLPISQYQRRSLFIIHFLL